MAVTKLLGAQMNLLSPEDRLRFMSDVERNKDLLCVGDTVIGPGEGKYEITAIDHTADSLAIKDLETGEDANFLFSELQLHWYVLKAERKAEMQFRSGTQNHTTKTQAQLWDGEGQTFDGQIDAECWVKQKLQDWMQEGDTIHTACLDGVWYFTVYNAEDIQTDAFGTVRALEELSQPDHKSTIQAFAKLWDGLSLSSEFDSEKDAIVWVREKLSDSMVKGDSIGQDWIEGVWYFTVYNVNNMPTEATATVRERE